MQYLQSGQTFPIGDFLLSDEGLFYKKIDKNTGKESFFKVCEPLFIKQTVQNIDTKDVHLDLCYKYKGTYHEMPIGMGQLIPNELIKLMAKGVDIPHEFKKIIATYLREQQKRAPHKLIFHQVGWHRNEKKGLVFRHNQLISSDPTYIATNDNEYGAYHLQPKGDLQTWLTMVKEQVVGHPPLETILSIGFASALIGYLYHLYDDIDTIVFHLAGNSTQGKTTAALLAVSVFGMPSNKKKGLMKNWNGTSNAILNMLGGNFGIPIVLDELSMSNAKSLTSELYVLASGQEKYRLTEDIKQRKQGMWALAIISTGEQSIFERTNHNAGLTVRTFEYSNIAWTKSAANADMIRQVIQENYGHAGEAFIKYLFEQGLHIIDETWKKWQERCEKALPDTPFRSRVAKKYAIILGAGELANKALEIGLNLDNILHFLVEQEKIISDERDIGRKAWNLVVQRIIQYQGNFKREGVYSNPFNCWGKMFPRSNYVEVAILKHVLEKELKELGFDDPKVIIKDWKERQWLITEHDRTTKRTRIFDATEQQERKRALGITKNPPKKLEDTTYNLKVPVEQFQGLVRDERFVQGLSSNENVE
ncbi:MULTISPECIES: DUF927 domain-containing protein [unclassified Geobacillus]|uniref:DUF927 domain-containing protein n=1 Tax=unclassified Geobacillus TaxID=2642459 RepID=UPI000C28564D|nr:MULTISPECIES: DUF927 domain-containing protein [unclassified Geobacillus]PJW13129.1 hypothetical protein CV945_15820 [Geobacillus sp. Manikaran-105]PJW16153.1 hypothetical protein CV944_16225 [Geobacillus sp. WSUCF-018B]